MAAQDPEERFDLVDAQGNLTGEVKARAAVHRDGDWHRAMHLWLLATGYATPRVLLQRRSFAKDTHGGLVDVSVGGHLRAGEGLEESLRESEEELGVQVPWSAVTPLARVCLSQRTAAYWDREVVDVLVAEVPLTLDALRPHPDEVAEVLAVDPWDAWGLWAGRCTVIEALARGHDPSPTRAVTLRQEEIVAPRDGYRAHALAALLERACRGRAVAC